MGICFIGQKRKFNEFLGEGVSAWRPGLLRFCAHTMCRLTANYLEPKPGPIYDTGTGAVVGTHGGLWTYTIGQGARLPGLKEKHFIVAKNKEENAIYVVNGP